RHRAAAAEQMEIREATVHAVSHRTSVIGEADVIIAATTSTDAHLHLNDIRPGTLVINVGLDDCAQDLLLGAEYLVVDSWNLVANDTNRLLGRLIRTGLVGAPGDGVSPGVRQQVDAELGQIITGIVNVRPGWQDRVVLNPFGMAVNDIAVATMIEQL